VTMAAILEVRNLNMHFPIRGGLLRGPKGRVFAVNDVSFDLRAGETFGIVGESGCGKSTLGRTLVRLYSPTSGHVLFKGQDISLLDAKALKSFRRRIQMIFQDPYASLNPRMTIERILEEPFKIHGIGTANERKDKARELLALVGLRVTDIHRFPHEFSGGQRQRIGIARALALNPELIVCDEAVSALDVSIQSQILNLLIDLQRKMGLTFIFISHDLNVVRYISDRVAVMYLGRLMELAASDEIYRAPAHPYTKALMAAAPVADPRRAAVVAMLEGDVPSPSRPPSGCPFHTRCPFVQDLCRRELPPLSAFRGDENHLVACHFAEELNQEALSR
jgi:oligopeptide/dipeptide ABC transporter ATP-binding protein